MNGLALFAGAGGIDLGLKLALPDDYRTVCYAEREAYAAATLVARMQDGALDDAPVWDDVATFDGRPWRGVVDLVSGGFPCQDISSAGLRAGIESGRRSSLWGEMARIVREVEPRYVFVENVGGLLVRGLDVVLGALADLGFDAEWGCVPARTVGAPHGRNRVFILAHAQRGGSPIERAPHDDDGRDAPRHDADGRGARPLGDAQGVRDPDQPQGVDAEALVRPVARADGRIEPRRVAAGTGERGGTDAAGVPDLFTGVGQADAGGERLEGRWAVGPPEGVGRHVGDEGGAVLPLWPPRPADRDGWRGYLAGPAP